MRNSFVLKVLLAGGGLIALSQPMLAQTVNAYGNSPNFGGIIAYPTGNNSDVRAEIRFTNPPMNTSNYPRLGNIEFWTGNFAPVSGGANGIYKQATLTYDGKFGIGVANPQSTLDVNGDAAISGKLTANALVQFNHRLWLGSGSNNATLRVARYNTDAYAARFSGAPVMCESDLAVSGSIQLNAPAAQADLTVQHQGATPYTAYFSGAPVMCESDLEVSGSIQLNAPAAQADLTVQHQGATPYTAYFSGAPVYADDEIKAAKGFRVSSNAGDNINSSPWYGMGMPDIDFTGNAAGNKPVQIAGFYGIGFKTQGTQNGGFDMVIDNGKVGIGTTNTNDPNYQLFVKTGIKTDKVRVATGWADYVFAPNYPLMPLAEVAQHIQQHGHLHNTPSAAEVEATGLDLGANAAQQQEKIEELYLHLIRMEERVNALERENAALKAAVTAKK